MTKQEEIRNGMRKFISDKGWRGLNFIEAEEVLTKYLHSQGVVIQTDRELPNWLEYSDFEFRSGYISAVTNGNYVAVEPLIKEVKNG